MSEIKRIESDGVLLAIVISNKIKNDESTFHTPQDSILQVGHVVVGPKRPIQRHFHNQIPRQTQGTSEVLVLVSGRVEVALYDLKLIEVGHETLSPGDIICLFAGGHGFKSDDLSTFIEIKNGPYAGPEDKVFF